MFERTQPKVSIIIPSWFTPEQNGKYCEFETFWLAQECLVALNRSIDPGEIKIELIIIDNGSTLHIGDRAAKERGWAMGTEEYFENADITIRNKKNLGFGPACNQGFALARGEYIVCLNNDVVVWYKWLERLIEVLEDDSLEKQAGVVMPALMKECGNDAREALKITSPDLSQNYNALGPGAEFGSLWMMKKELMDEIIKKDGFLFDENFRLGMGEDRDLWDRVRRMGRETYRTHKTRVFHQGNMTIAKFKDRKKYTSKNREYLAELKKARDNN